ncbi:hypothetical protein [Amycolatopsis orientalis]|uniref:hypothetical protein n=1 Tax=Amycolatopsis orientalis TaxID=31958 RepID=UPI000408D33B|nr:hypothetical protein [Amycolatopsis orientalis]
MPITGARSPSADLPAERFGGTAGTGHGSAAEPSLLDVFAPRPAFVLAETSPVDAPAAAVYRAIGELRSADVPSRVVRTLVRVRGLPETLRRHGHAPDLGEIVLGERGTFLGERPGHEMVLGAAGRFWTPVPEWYEVTPESFREFDHARSGTIAMAFSVEPGTGTGSRLTVETRITVTDPSARHAISLYWHAIRPAARFTTRALLDTIAAHAATLTDS